MPRHARINEQIVDDLCGRIRAGNSLKAAADGVGVSEATLHRWKSRGEVESDRLEAEPDSAPLTTEWLYRKLYEAVTQAMADAEAGRVVQILNAGRPHEEVTRVETLRHFKLRQYDAENRPVDVIEQRTDVRTETKTVWDWRADAWWLEHARVAFWGRQTPAQVGESEQVAEVDADIETRTVALVDELQKRREALAAANQ